MTIKHRAWAFALLWAAICPQISWAQWITIGDGFEYREFTVSGPNNCFVARMQRSNLNCTLETSIAGGKLYSGKETVRNQASRYDGAINYWGQTWGQRNQVVVAVNGDFYNTTTGVPAGGQIHSGWYSKRFPEFGGWSGMAWKLNRTVFMGGCVNHTSDRQYVRYHATGATQTFNGINESRGTDHLILYTPQYDNNTHTDHSGVEVLVQLSEPLLIKPQPAQVIGTVREIRQNQGSSWIPFDHIVLSATGSRATTLLANVSIGATIGISQELNDYESGCSTRSSNDWTKTYACVGGNFIYLANGVARPTDNAGLIVRHPRTAVAYNDTYIFFIVVDGRSTASVGMTMAELATFSVNSLAATWGYNLDGGGSSTMVVNGQVKNVPSDGPERAVANGIMMVNVLPKVQSTLFAVDNVVRTTASTSVRLGPGTNYESFASLPTNREGTILAHSLAGVLAKGQNWWRCDFDGTAGWVQESQLAFVSGDLPPVFTQHPAGRTVLPGGNATFIAQATGTAPLSYRWQKDTVDLNDGGPYSGAQTTMLTVAGVTPSEAGSYRCVATNIGGSVPSNTATLAVGWPDFDNDNDADLADFAHLQWCLGTTNLEAAPQCANADLNGDRNVDTLDVLAFKLCASGEMIPINLSCGANP